MNHRRKQNENVLRQQQFLNAVARDKVEKGIDWFSIFSDPKERHRFQMRLYQEAMAATDNPVDTEYPDVELL